MQPWPHLFSQIRDCDLGGDLTDRPPKSGREWSSLSWSARSLIDTRTESKADWKIPPWSARAYRYGAGTRARSIAFALCNRRLQLHLRRLGPRPLERQTGPRQP